MEGSTVSTTRSTIPQQTSNVALASDIWAIGLGLLALLAWEAARLDLPLQRLWGDSQGFIWRHHWLTEGLLHSGARTLAWLVLGLIVAGLVWPGTFAGILSRRDRLWLIGTTLFCVALIPLLKLSSTTSCPWALAEFGGGIARYVPHWAFGEYDGGPGGCFPSGHASTAFAFLGGWFLLRSKASRAGKVWLIFTVIGGMALGWSQMIRGAHYLSHSLWTAWLCWAITAVSFHAFSSWRAGKLPVALRIAAPVLPATVVAET